jgi:hypothetical protein
MIFRHHPDGLIYLGNFSCTLEEFTDQRPDYTLPEGVIGRIYRPDIIHALFDNESNQQGGPLPWTDGDEYIQNADSIIAAITLARQPLPFTLEQKRNQKLAEVDNNTQLLINEGFPFSNKIFSLSGEAQINWTNMFIAKSLLSYPLEISTKDNGVHTFDDVNQVSSFYATGIAAVKAMLDSGRSLKQQIIAAQTEEELDLINDARVEPTPEPTP